MSTETPGLVLVFTGQGKGKTTAALGVVFRALGHGLKVAVVQFIKGKWKTGERMFAASIPSLTFQVMGCGFTWESDDLSRDQGAAQRAWAEAERLIMSGEQALVVLDELTYVISYGFVGEQEIMDVLARRPAHVNVIITGRHASECLCACADVVTDMRAVKHPFEQGLRARAGIDF